MDKVADFYERWYATRRIPDYLGVESASEELAKEILGVYESEKRDFWQSCGVQFLRGTILHLSSQAHMRGEETMTVRHVIEFLEAQPIENRWEELIASQAGNEHIRWLASRAGELMVNSPPPVGRAILETVLSRLLETWARMSQPAPVAGEPGYQALRLRCPSSRILKGEVNP